MWRPHVLQIKITEKSTAELQSATQTQKEEEVKTEKKKNEREREE